MISPNSELVAFELAKSLQFYGSIVLRIPAKPIEKITKDTKLLIKEMMQIMSAFGASGLAANQIGLLVRIIVVNLNEPIAMINPEVIHTSEEKEAEVEGCLSIPGVWATVNRPKEITVKYLNEEGEELQLKAEGLAARIIQHEVDHLNALLIIDTGT